MLTIATWNVNGIRALKGPLKQRLDVLNSDIICLQETKVTSECLQWPMSALRRLPVNSSRGHVVTRSTRHTRVSSHSQLVTIERAHNKASPAL